MRAELVDAGYFSASVRILWPEHTLEELVEIIVRYINSENSAVLAEVENGQYVRGTLCCPRHDYVERCKTRPVGYLEGVSIREEYRHRGIARKLNIIWCGYFDGNEKSKRVQDKCGFHYHHKAYDVPCAIEGVLRTEHITCLSREEWQSAR